MSRSRTPPKKAQPRIVGGERAVGGRVISERARRREIGLTELSGTTARRFSRRRPRQDVFSRAGMGM